MVNFNKMLSPKKANDELVEKGVIRKRVKTEDFEKWEVVQLKCNIEPLSKPTDLFKKLEKRRKIRHENFLRELAKSLHEVNTKTEKNITMSSKELKAHTKDFDDKLKDILKSIDTPEVASHPSSVFFDLQNTANDYKWQQQKFVNELYEDLITFENERAKENEKIFHLACEELRKIGYFLPYEVQTFVEHETLKMNQLSLNNRRCYEDLKLTLTLVTEQTYKSFMDKVYCSREKWIQHKLNAAFRHLQNQAEKKVARLIPEAYARLEVKGQELVVQMAPNNLYSSCKVEEWSKNVQKVVGTLDAHGRKLINIYKKTLEAVYSGFDKKVEEVKAEMNFIENLTIEERIIKPIVFDSQNDQDKEVEEIEIYWQTALDEIRTQLSDVTGFLLDAGKLWDRHMARVCESKILILKALEKSDKNSLAILQDLEIKLNICLDVLRQEHIETKLEKAHETVVAILNSIKEKYESIYLEDVSTIEDFYKMMDLEADVLSADIKEFIYEVQTIDFNRIMHVYPEHYRCLPEDKPIFKEIHMCVQQIQAVKSWKQGVWIALEILSDKTRESLQPQVESWIEKKIEILAEKKSIQLELLDKRIERIRIEIFNKRLEEIKLHQEMLDQHKKKVEFELDKMKEDFQNFISKELKKIQYIKENLAEIEENAIVENRPGIIRGNLLMMERKKKELENDFKMSFERFRADCETVASDIKQWNIGLIKSIKLFHENGSYSTEEGKMYVTLLELVDKEVSTELKNVIKDSTKEENDFNKKLTSLFSPLITLFSSLYEETLFKQEVLQRLQNFTLEIRDVAKTVKLDYEFLKKKCYCLCNSVKSSDETSWDADEKFWKYLTQLLYKNVSNLVYPVSFSEPPSTTIITSTRLEQFLQQLKRRLFVANLKENEEGSGEEVSTCPCCTGKFPVYVNNSKTITLHTSERGELLNCRDYKNQFFKCETPPKNDGTFMALMCNYFWKEINFLQKIACNFYKNLQGRKIIREDLIPLNYDIFMNEILTKLSYYNIQVEQFWLQVVLDFLPLLGLIKSLANSFLEKKLYGYENLALEALKNFKEEFCNCLESQRSENLKELEAFDNKLLPLHGYYKNENFLNALEEDIVRTAANQKILWEAAFKKFKKQLKCFRLQHIQEKLEIKKIEIHHSRLQSTIFLKNLSDDLLDELLSCCINGEFYVKKPFRDSLLSEKESENGKTAFENEKIPEEHKVGIEFLNKDHKSTQSYLKNIRQIIQRERFGGMKSPTCPPCSDKSEESIQGEDICEEFCKPKLNLLLEIIDMERYTGKILDKLDEYIRSMKVFAKCNEKSHDVLLFNWLEKWKFSVKKIMKLYRVKYEEKSLPVKEASQLLSGK